MARKSLDWESIRRDYEIVGLNPDALAEKYSCSSTYVYQRIRADGWRKPIEDEEIDPEFLEDEIEISKHEANVELQKLILSRLMKEIDISTTKVGQIKQWIKEATLGKIDSQRKVAFQMITLQGRLTNMEKAAKILKTIVETEIALGSIGEPKGKKAKADAAASELDDDRFGTMKMPKVA